MSSRWFSLGLTHILKGDVTGGLGTASLRAALFTNAYEFDDLDEVLSNCGTPVSTCALTSVAVTAGTVKATFTADPAVFSSVPAGSLVDRVVIYWESGVPATRYVIAFNELEDPVLSDNGNINVTWSATGIACITTA